MRSEMPINPCTNNVTSRLLTKCKSLPHFAPRPLFIVSSAHRAIIVNQVEFSTRIISSFVLIAFVAMCKDRPERATFASFRLNHSWRSRFISIWYFSPFRFSFDSGLIFDGSTLQWWLIDHYYAKNADYRTLLLPCSIPFSRNFTLGKNTCSKWQRAPFSSSIVSFIPLESSWIWRFRSLKFESGASRTSMTAIEEIAIKK